MADNRLFRVIGAAPDAATAAWCAYVWIAPRNAGVQWVRQILVAMLLEFLVVHSGAYFSRFMGVPDAPWRRIGAGLLLLLAYLGLAAAFSAIFDTWWPLAGMAWLLGMKYWTLVLDRADDTGESERQFALWAVSVVFFVGLGVLSSLLPLPELGIDAGVRSELELPGAGLWVEQPYRVVAFAVFYFVLLALVKYWYHPPGSHLRNHAQQ